MPGDEQTSPVIFKTRQTAALVVYSLLLALAVGLGSAYLVLNGDPPFGGRRVGPWSSWPKLGSDAAWVPILNAQSCTRSTRAVAPFSSRAARS